MSYGEVKSFLKSKKGYLKWGSKRLKKKLKCEVELINRVKDELKNG